MDFHRRYEQKHVDSVAEVPEPAEPEDAGVDPALVEAALSVFVELPPLQRSALILKDVLGHSLEEVGATLGVSVGAVKSALTRARANLAPRSSQASGPRSSPEDRRNLQRYVDLFNAQNWDGLRALLAEESRLDLVSRLERRAAEARYYDQYATILRSEQLRAEPGLVDGEPAIAIFSSAGSARPAYFVLLEWQAGRITRIRDFRYVPYIANDARFTPFTG
jgi:RNA polymerase sigma-70 factor (ECF subfamily)